MPRTAPRAVAHKEATVPVVDRAAFERLVQADVVILGRAEYERLIEAAADTHDRAAGQAALDEIAVGAPTTPHAVAKAIFAGDHPVRAWRRYRGLTIEALATGIGASPGQISMIENRKRTASVNFLGRLAKAFGCSAADLVED